MQRSMTLGLAFLVLGALNVGCQGQEGVQSSNEPSANSSQKLTEPAASPEASADSSQVKPGMDMTEVKKLKGVPKETKHEHGAGDAEIDIWIYEDQTVTFTNGKVSE